MSIAKITDVFIRHYTDNRQVTVYVEWQDQRGRRGRTEGPADNQHMWALLNRAEREGIALRSERW